MISCAGTRIRTVETVRKSCRQAQVLADIQRDDGVIEPAEPTGPFGTRRDVNVPSRSRRTFSLTDHARFLECFSRLGSRAWLVS